MPASSDNSPVNPAAALGRLGGLSTSAAKRRAVRANGKKGGRPKGSKDSYPRKRSRP